MGADGHLHYLSRESWDNRWPYLSPFDCGLKIVEFGDVEFVLGYRDSTGQHFEDWADIVLDEKRPQVEAALNWFSINSKQVELWT